MEEPMRGRAWWLLGVGAVAATPLAARLVRAQEQPEASAVIVTELRAFYRDLRAKRTAALLDHFWPSKVTARWEPPTDEPTWVRLSTPRATMAGSAPSSPCIAGTDPPITASVAVVGRWARALVTPCDASGVGRADELWFVEMSAKWRIVRLTIND
jgi:hypothetical protein